MFRQISPFCLSLLLGACGSPQKPSYPKPAPKSKSVSASERGNPTALLPAYELARVEPGTYGPISVSLNGGILSVWASPGQTERTWRARVIERDGHASTNSLVLGKSGPELGLVTLASVTQGLRGLLVFSTQISERATKLSAMLLDAAGLPKTPFTELATVGATLLWTQIVDTDKGPLVVYAVSRDDTAEVRAVGLTQDGTLRSADRSVATGLRAWQAVAAPEGAVLAVVRSKGKGSVVSLMLLDQTGAALKAPLDFDGTESADFDLDLTRIGKHYLLAWSDKQRIDARVQIAAVNAAGELAILPRPALPGIGEQSLVKIVPPVAGGRAVLVWENASLPFSRRMLSLSEIDEKGELGKRIVHLACSSRSNTLPEIVATEEGIRAITYDDSVGASQNAMGDPLPTFVEFGPELTPRAAVPLTLLGAGGTPVVPLLAWGLDCRHGCRATAALDDTPVTIATIPLTAVAERPNARDRAAQLVQSENQATPRLSKLDSVVEVEPLADLSVTQQKTGFLMSAVTYFDPSTPLKRLAKPGPDGRTDPLQARVDVFSLGADGNASAPQPLSLRASSLPGLAISSADSESAGSAVAWSALDQGQPQVFVSLLDSDGKKRSQRMLTRKKGRLDEVELAPNDDGWILGWADDRSGDLEVYTTRLTKTLERRGTEQRLTNAVGDVSALALVPLGPETVVIFAEARRLNQQRNVSLYTRRIASANAQPLEAERRIVDLSGSAKFMRAVKYADGILLSWLEVPAEGGPSEASARLYYVLLDAKGQVVSQPTQVVVRDAVPAAMAVDCPNSRCHGAAIVDVGGRGELQAFTFDPRAAAAPAPVPLARSMGTVEQNVAPVLLGEHVFMVDQIDAERARVVHAKIIWE